MKTSDDNERRALEFLNNAKTPQGILAGMEVQPKENDNVQIVS